MINASNIVQAHERLKSVLSQTPLASAQVLSERYKREIFIKFENKHHTGSFKERGAANFLTKLIATDKSSKVFAASAGNHALAVSRHAARLNIPCNIVMPMYAPLVKVQNTRANGASVELHGTTFDDANQFAKDKYDKEAICVPAFNHLDIIEGQGTIAFELLEQIDNLDAVIVPVGGGGLISGIATYIKEVKPEIAVLGVQSEWAVEGRKGKHSKQGLSPATIADGIAVKRVGEITEKIVKKYVDELITVSESEIARSIIDLLRLEHIVAEGAGAAGFAAIAAGKINKKYKKLAVILCGSNIDLNVLGRLIERDMAQDQKLLQVNATVPDRPGSLNMLTGLIADCHANVIRVLHDRSFASEPGSVEIRLVLEVQDSDHAKHVLKQLKASGIVTY